MGGEYKVDGDEIKFGAITSTLMACDEARMAQEGVVAQVLSGTATYQIQNNTLTLTNNDTVLILVRVSDSYPYP
jgi:heat shock protein HslJ